MCGFRGVRQKARVSQDDEGKDVHASWTAKLEDAGFRA